MSNFNNFSFYNLSALNYNFNSNFSENFSGENGALYAIFSFFKNRILPQAQALAQKLDLYYVSLCIFAAAIIIGGVSMLIRVCLRRARQESCGRVLLLFTLCFFADLLICFSELNFCGKYFKTATEAYIFCFLKFIVLLVLYFMLAVENSVLKKLDKKDDKTNLTAPHRVIYEQPAPPLFKSAPSFDSERSSFKGAPSLDGEPQRDLNKNRGNEANVPRYISYFKSSAEKFSRPDVNIGYILALCEGLKKEPLTQTERERITDLELGIKTNDFSTPKQAEALNEELRWLIKKAALCEYKPNALF